MSDSDGENAAPTQRDDPPEDLDEREEVSSDAGSDDGAGGYEEDGFLVDSLSEDEEQPKQQKLSRLKKKREKKRKRQKLGLEDLELIQENTGISVAPTEPPKKNRKRAEKRDADSDFPTEPRSPKLSDVPSPIATRDIDEPRRRAPSPPPREEEDEFISEEEDDFIVDDDDGVEEPGEELRPIRRKRRQEETGGITTEQLRTAEAMYNFDEYLAPAPGERRYADDDDLFGTGDYDEPAVEELADKMKMYYKHGFEPSLLEERFITPADDKIRETDIPERLQLRRDAERILSAPSEEELAAEASWIGSQIKQSSDKYYAPEEVAVKVLNVLRLLLVDKFEIPFIDMYRKEHWHPELRKPDLWQIYDLDEMWAYFQRRKRDYMRCLNAMSAPDSELERIIQNVAVEEELNDLREHFTLHDDSASRATSGGSKRPERRDDYSVAKKALLGKLADNFGLSVVQIAKNVFAEYAQEIANDEEKTPEEVAESFVVPEFPTEERALEGARLVLAKNIAFHPSIRKYLREKLVPTCSVTTHPTDRGLEEVDEFHAVWDALNLESKPIDRFANDPGQFTKILKAEKDGLLTLTIGYDPSYVEDLKREFCGLFVSEGTTDVADQWNAQRKLIMEKVIDLLVPLFLKEVRTKLKKESDEQIINNCAGWLEGALLAGPYKASHTDEEADPIRIMAIARSEKTTDCVQLDPYGEVVDSLTVNSRFQAKDDELVVEFIRRNMPSVIAVAADGAESKRTYDALKSMVVDLRAQPELANVRAITNLTVVYADAEAARIFEHSQRAAAELPDFSPGIRKAASVGRQLLDPLLEFCGLWNPQSPDVLFLRARPPHEPQGVPDLQYLKGQVDEGELKKKLERVFLNVVNAVGVDINRISSHKWMKWPLQFISGLGPRKADTLLQGLATAGAKIETRDQLEELMGKHVWRNAIGFIKVFVDEDEDSYGSPEILDQTRIHPDDYKLARKIAKDAFTERERERERDVDYVEKLMTNPQKLEEIDIDYFAQMLEETLRQRKRESLYDIKNELNNPFADPRSPYEAPTATRVLYMLLGETPKTLRKGQFVQCRIGRITRAGINVTLDNGLPGFIGKDDITDLMNDEIEQTLRSTDELSRLLPMGLTIPARLTELDFETFQCRLSAKESVLRYADYEVWHVRDQFVRPVQPHRGPIVDLLAPPASAPSVAVRRARPTRNIAHPYYKSMSATEAEEYLADKEYDEFVIRPSSDPDQIAVTFKFSPWSYVHIKAVEDGDSKDPSSNKTYKIGSSVFDDINQLVLEYVDPLMTFVAEMRSFRYFQDLRSPEIERICQEKKVAQPKHNPYFIGPSDQAGSFLLHYIPGTRTVVKESVTVTPSGYRFRGKMFQSTGDLFNWFKKHFAEGPPKKQRPAATPNPRTPAAPVTNGQYAPGSWGGAGWPQQQQNNWVGYSAGGVEDLWAATPAAAPNQWAAQPAASASDPWSANTTSTW